MMCRSACCWGSTPCLHRGLPLLGLVLLVPPLFRRRLYRWQGGVCLGLYLLYLAAVLLAPRAGA